MCIFLNGNLEPIEVQESFSMCKCGTITCCLLQNFLFCCKKVNHEIINVFWCDDILFNPPQEYVHFKIVRIHPK